MYTWTVDGTVKTGTLLQLACSRFKYGAARCTIPDNVTFTVKEVKRNWFVGYAVDSVTGETANTRE